MKWGSRTLASPKNTGFDFPLMNSSFVLRLREPATLPAKSQDVVVCGLGTPENRSA